MKHFPRELDITYNNFKEWSSFRAHVLLAKLLPRFLFPFLAKPCIGYLSASQLTVKPKSIHIKHDSPRARLTPGTDQTLLQQHLLHVKSTNSALASHFRGIYWLGGM
jgi:hypothetical protein